MTPFDLVTGGAGFIGSHLCRRLLHEGRRIKILDNLSTGSRGNLSDLQGAFEFVEGDIRDLELLRALMAGCEVIYHQAAIPSVQFSIDDPLESSSVNVNGTLCLLAAAREAEVRSVVLASSCAVYGDSPELPKRESMQFEPLSPYAASKACDELYARSFSVVYGLKCTALRYFNVFGPRQNPQSDYAAVIPRFIARMLAGQPPIIFGDGEQSRDFVYVENVVSANLLAAERQSGGVVANIGSGGRWTLNQLVGKLNEILGADFEPEYRAARPGDIRDSQSDISVARECLGFRPEIDLHEGLERTVEWFRLHPAGV